MLAVRQYAAACPAALMAALIILLSGCVSPPPSVVSDAGSREEGEEEELPVGEAEEDTYDVLRVVLWGEGITLNPAEVAADDLASSFLARHLYRGLVRVGPGGEVQPDVARHWTAEADGRTWEFHLRLGAQMHDGTPITADLLRALYADAPEDSPLARRLRGVRKVEAVSADVLRFHLENRQPDFPAAVAGDPALSIALYRGADEVVSSGPYQYIRRSSRGGIIARGVDPGGSTLRSVEFVPLSPMAAAGSPEHWSEEVVDLLESADAITPLGPEAGRSLTLALGLRMEVVPSPNVRGIIFNDRGILHDPRVRAAAFSAVGQGEEILEVPNLVDGPLLPVNTWLPAGHVLQEVDAAAMSVERDAERAAHTLEDAGLRRREDGTWRRATEAGIEVPVQFTFLAPRDVYAGGEEVARRAAAALEDIGLSVQLEVTEWSRFSSRFFASNYDLAFVGWSRPTPAAGAMLRPWLHSEGAITINRGDHLGLDGLFTGSALPSATALRRAGDAFRLLPLYTAPLVLALGSEVDAEYDDSFMPLLVPRP